MNERKLSLTRPTENSQLREGNYQSVVTMATGGEGEKVAADFYPFDTKYD